MRGAFKIAGWTLGGLVMLILLLAGGIIIFANTDAGRSAIEKLTYRITGGHVQVSGLTGSLPRHLRVEKLQLSDKTGVWLTAERIVLDWSPSAYLEGRLQVDNLQVARVDMERLPQSSSTANTGDVSIPRIDVAHATIDVLQLGAELAGAPASLAAHGSVHLRTVRDMVIEASARRTDGDGDYELHLRFDPQRMDAALKLHEPASGPLENILTLPGLGALDATVNLNGPRAAEQLEVSLQAGGLSGHAQGSLNLSELSADLNFVFESTAMNPRPDLAWERAKLQGRWKGSIKAPTATGHLEATRLRLPGGAQMATLNADIDADRGKAALRAVVLGLRIPGQQPRLLEDEPLRIEASMRLDDPARPLELTASHKLFSLRAQAVTGGKQSAALELRLPNLTPLAAFGGQDIRGSAVVKAQLDGYPAAPHVKLDSTAALNPGAQFWSGAVGNSATLQLSATFKDQALVIESSKITGRAASLSANGTVGSGNITARWNLDVSDLSALSPILAGTLKASGSLGGPTTALNAEAMMSSSVSVRGSQSGILSAEVKVRDLPSRPSGTLTAHGSFDEAPLQVDVALERGPQDSMHTVIHRAIWKSARLDGDVTLGTADARPHGQLAVTVSNLSDLKHLLGMDIAGSLTGSLSFQPQHQRTRMSLQLDGHDLAVAHLNGSAHLSGEGFTDSFGFKASLEIPKLNGAEASLAAQGILNLDAREVSIASARLDYRGQDAHLLAPARVNFATGLSVDTLKLGAQQAELTVQGQIAPTLEVRATLRQVRPALVNVFVPNLLAAGLIEAHADLHGSAASPTGEVALSATGIRMADDAALGLPAADLRVTTQLRGHTADVDARLDAGPASQLHAAGQAPIALDGAVDMKINGKLDIGLLNPLLEARGQHATGQLDINATVGGSVAEPQIGGTLSLTQGSLRDYGRGVGLTDIAAQVVGKEGTLQIESFTASAPPGKLSMSGSVGILQPGLPVDLKITAQNAQPIVSKLVTANLNAELTVKGTARERLDIAGTVNLNRTLIGIPNGLPPNVAVLDVRRRGKAAAPVPEKPLIIGLKVDVQAPQQILVQGRGLDAEMGGQLQIRGTTDSPRVSGGFDLQRGTFSVAGNKLNFTQGRIAFSGAGLNHKIDPTLDFTAQTSIADATTATMRITGFADEPIFEFSSNPSRPQDDIMALLLFGVPANQLSPIQLAQIGVALASLSGVGGDSGLNPLVKLQKSLGLDRLTIGTGTTTTTATGIENSGASIEAGRYISKRVYIEGRQTSAGTSQVGAVVDLTKHLKLQTRLGNGTASVQGTTPENDPGSSIGLTYQFEY
jgi:translocation and assembly module TamB